MQIGISSITQGNFRERIQRKRAGQRQVRLSRRVGITGSLLLTVLVIFLGRTGLLYDLELKSYDARFMLRGPVEVDSSEVVIVVVDDETLSVMPHGWPFPRSYHAKLIENLLAAGGKADCIRYPVYRTTRS